MTETAKGTRLSEVGRVAVTVADQDRALDFYVGTLGFDKRADIPFGEGQRWIEVGPSDGGAGIALVNPQGCEGADESGSGPRKETGIILTSEDIDADHTTLREAGVDTDPEVMRYGAPVPPMFSFRDPDGNAIMVVSNE
ncbi:VOC family protein [Streptomyces sp. NA02950]|uniref:VOC family protein n=1 Tax=Streptomyces sp. NA02950 TaxID=2742137 RepID=UPI001591F2A1|nr:VOC family protein [Streptomyces sp. NA02950]QKV92888.1 VOC family protein [Streptomyces sp. NA02950]